MKIKKAVRLQEVFESRTFQPPKRINGKKLCVRENTPFPPHWVFFLLIYGLFRSGIVETLPDLNDP